MGKIHDTAVIEDGAKLLGDNIEVGPYAVVGGDAVIYDNVKIHGHAMISGHTTLREGAEVFPFAHIGGKTQDLKYKGGDTYVDIGERTVLREYVTVNCGTSDGEVTKVGADCLIMAYCHIAHGCVFEDHVIVSNGSHFAGEVHVEEHATISGLCAVHQFTRIGRHCMLGAGVIAVQDIPPYFITAGNPPVVHGINIVGLTRRGFPEETRSAIKEAYKILYRTGKNTSDALEEIESSLPALPEISNIVNFYKNTKRGVVK